MTATGRTATHAKNPLPAGGHPHMDPRNADAYTALALVQVDHGNRLDAEQSFKHALALDPLNPQTLQLYSSFLAHAARIKEAVAMREQLRALDPLAPVFNTNAALTLLTAGDNAQALAIAEALPSDFGQRAIDIAMIYAATKKYTEAADAILTAPRELYPPEAIETASRLLRMAPAPTTRENIPDLGPLSWVFVYVGLPERALEFAEHLVDVGFGYPNLFTFWSSDYTVVRKTERFKTLVRRMGLVDYWRAKGWPEFCHPTTGDDFACD